MKNFNILFIAYNNLAGSPHTSFDLEAIKKLAGALDYIAIIPRLLSEQEFSDYAAISSSLLLPYRKITGSGALLAALILTRGVIATDLPYFQSVLGENSSAGRVVPPEDPSALSAAIREYLLTPSKTREEAAAQLAEHYSWHTVVRPVVDVIRTWKNSGI